MGAFNSKFDGEYLPSTPIKSSKVCPAPLDLDESIHNLTQDFTNFDIDIVDDFGSDPRSPTVCRTPLNELPNLRQRITKNRNLTSEISTPAKNEFTNNFMKEKLMRTLGLNLLDPRSPSQNIDRTPIVFKAAEKKAAIEINVVEFVNIDEQKNESIKKSASIAVIEKINEDIEIIEERDSSSYLETNFELSVEPETPKHINEIDPRSPSIGIDRTPLVLENESVIVVEEDEIPAELTETQKTNDSENSEVFLELSIIKPDVETIEPLSNIPIENLEKKSKRLSQIPKVSKELCKLIYEDSENVCQQNITPKKATDNWMGGNIKIRTPLSCVANRPHTRSKSNNDTNNKPKFSLAEIHNSNYDDKFIKNKIEIIATDENTPNSLNKRESKIPIFNRKMSN